MTEKEEIEQTNTLITYKILLGALGAVLLLVLGAFVTDNKSTKDKIDTKASTEYVNMRDKEIEEAAERKRLEMKADFTAILKELKEGQAEIKQSIDRRNGLDYIKDNKPIRK